MKQRNLLLCFGMALTQVVGATPAAEPHHIKSHNQGSLIVGEKRAVSDVQWEAMSIPEHESLEARQTVGGDCRRGLACSYTQIEGQSIDWRRGYIRTIQNDYLTGYNSGSQFRNVEGWLTFLIEVKLGATNTWSSCVTAGLIEAIQNAVGIIVGLHSRDGGNPGVKLWIEFFKKMRTGGYNTDRNKHDYDWATCEETSSEYGRSQAIKRGYRMTQPENAYYKSNQGYRYTMQNRASSSTVIRIGISGLDGVLNGVLGGVLALVNGLLNFITDVTSVKSGYSFCKSSAGYFDGGSSTTSYPASDVLKGILPGLLSAYKSR